MSTTYFHRDGDGFAPTPDAVGPWAPDMMHGRFFGGLAARALEAEFGEAGLRVARLTVDLFRPAPMEAVQVSTRSVRRGRRIRVADAVITVAGNEVASTRAVLLAEGAPPPGHIWRAEPWVSPHPDTLPRPDQEDPSDGSGQPAWDFRVHEGGVSSSERSRVWTNESGHLVDDEPLTPVVRSALSSDLASPLSNGSDDGIGYINGDYTLAMARYPVGQWVGLETTTHLAADGIAVGASTMYDLDGPFGTSTTTALANPILG
ncbi:MAG: thioesterase family protein [Actinomycetota bacterium]|jgi:hypothetical protein|nr:thioesterase family protein [Actinomycetota bacterium]